MKIAVVYKDGQVAGHFGHAEAFKIYEIENGEVLKSEVVPFEGHGHEAAVSFMKEEGVAAVLTETLGEHAMDALMEAEIAVFTAIEGDADEAVQAFLSGLLSPAQSANNDSCGCGGNCGDGCGEGCGGGCGGCGSQELTPQFEGTNVGKTMRVHYRGTLDDGTQFDSSYDRGEPLEFVCGVGMMIRGFDKAVAEMQVGEEKDIHLEPAEAYGERYEEMVMTAKIADLPGSEALEVGQTVMMSNAGGQRFPVTCTAKTDTEITLDANHQMAGKALNFHIEVVEIH